MIKGDPGVSVRVPSLLICIMWIPVPCGQFTGSTLALVHVWSLMTYRKRPDGSTARLKGAVVNFYGSGVPAGSGALGPPIAKFCIRSGLDGSLIDNTPI